jgi:ribose-phosphate pyrophosphokinase
MDAASVHGELLVFGGSASPKLTGAICARLGVPVGQSEVIRFSEGTLFVRIGENVRGRDSIRARVCADALEAAGADRIVAVDLHSPQLQGFFRIPVDDLQARPTLCDAVVAAGLGESVVVSPDEGFVKRATMFADRLGTSLAIGHKRRRAHDERAELVELIGDVEGQPCLIVDDFVGSGGTLMEVARTLKARGAMRVVAAVTHGVFSGDASERLDRGPIDRLYVTDTVENHPVPLSPKTCVVSIAPLLAEAILRIHRRESISVLFRD